MLQPPKDIDTAISEQNAVTWQWFLYSIFITMYITSMITNLIFIKVHVDDPMVRN